MRIEHDFLGQMELEDQAYYGIQTVRGVQNSNVTGHTYGEDGMKVVRAMARIKKAAALANEQIGALDEKRAWAIGVAADEVLAGKLDDQFPVDMVTGGGGVSIHMNLNEVLAHRASMLLDGMEVHPNTHVNMGQSTNDVLPSAMLLTTHSLILEVVKAVDVLADAVAERAEAFKDVVKLGRTCLQDATPVTVGQELTGWHSFLLRHRQLLLYRADDSIYLEKGMEAMTLEAFNSVPFAPVIKAFMLLIIAVPFITLANSMISTIASMSIKNSSENEEAPFGLKLFWGIIIAAAALVFTLAGGIDGVKMVKTFAGFPIVFLGIVMIVGFIVDMAKRPRDAAGNFEYEEAIANAPDNGEPCAPPSPTMEKLKAWIHSKKK